MIGSGLYEVEVNGKKIGFKFGMMASMHTEEQSGQTITEVFQGIAKGRLKPIAYYFLGGLLAYNEAQGVEEEVKISEVASIIESIGLEKALEIYLASIGSPKIKNGQAPKEAGQVGA